MTLKEKAKQLKVDIPAVFLCLKSKETPLIARLLAAVTVAYALSPIDLVPDFIPILGYLDDVILLPLLISLTIQLIPAETFERFRKDAEGLWQDGSPQKWFFALPVAAVWLGGFWLAKELLC